MGRCLPLEVQKGCQASCRVQEGTCAFSRAATGKSELSSCGEGILEVPFELVQGNLVLSRVEGEINVLLTFRKNTGVLLEFQ